MPAEASILSNKKGKGGSEVQGAAGTEGAQGEASDLQKCEMIFLGEEKDGFLKVEGTASGWVKKIMVGR